MNIREWNSNSSNFVRAIPEDKRNSKEVVSVLGLEWDTKMDTLRIAIDPITFSRPVTTKRDTLRMVASVFDPCGFIAPLTLPARLLHQELWKDKCKWDDKITQNRLEEWYRCVQLLKSVKNTCLPRAFLRPLDSNVDEDSYQLHCFTDASKDAYAAVVYLRITSKDENSVSFVMSRSKLTPLKQRKHMTIPKLELLGALIGVRLLSYIEHTLSFARMKTYLWTDSQIVISWIRSDRLLPPFVTRRVAEIKSARNVEFRYVPTKLNPADVATRVVLVNDLPSLWSDGPQFLMSSEENWPRWEQTTAYTTSEQVPTDFPMESEVTEPIVADHIVESAPSVPVEKCESTSTSIAGHSDTINDIKRLQMEHFPREIKEIRTDLTNSLRLFVDQHGVLRCNAKLQNSNIPFEQKCPILLPKDTTFTRNVIMEIHEKNHHVGITHTLALLRKRFWVPSGRTQVLLLC